MKTDYQIQNDVQAELKWAPQINGAEIGVAVKDGIVTLSGTVKTYAQKTAAERAAIRVAGVRAVAEEIKVSLGLTGQKTDKEIAESVLTSLKWNTSIDESRIQVKVENGVVTLQGEVDWDFQRVMAYNSVENLSGVRWVIEQLTIKPRPASPDIRQKIQNAFQRNATIDASHIGISIDGTKVILTGKVSSFAEKEQAASAAWSAPGVLLVDNRLEVAAEKQYAL